MSAPVLRDVEAAAEPYAVETRHVLQQLNQPSGAAGTPDQAVVQSDRKQLRRSCLTFGIEQVEGVADIGEEILRSRKAGILVEAVVVGLVGIGNDQMRPLRRRDPLRQLVGDRAAIIDKSPSLSHLPPCM